MIRLARRPQRRDNGFGLVEMMISMSIFALVMSLVVALLITAQKQTAATSIRLDDIDQARMAIDSLSRTMRTAVEPAQLQVGCTSCNGPASTSTALTSAQPASLQLFANGGSAAGPSLVTFTASYDSSRSEAILTKTVQPPDPNSAPNFTYTACTPGPGCLITTLPLVRGLAWPLPRPLFTYYDNAGLQLSPPENASLPPRQLISVDSIAINLTVKTPNPYNTGPTSITSRVGLPNSGSGLLATPPPAP